MNKKQKDKECDLERSLGLELPSRLCRNTSQQPLPNSTHKSAPFLLRSPTEYPTVMSWLLLWMNNIFNRIQDRISTQHDVISAADTTDL